MKNIKLKEIKPTTKRHIYDTGLYKIIHEDLPKGETKLRKWAILLLIVTVIALVIMVMLYSPDWDWLNWLVCAVILFLPGAWSLIFFRLSSTKNVQAVVAGPMQMIQNLSERHGPVKEVLKSIDSQFYPQGTVYVTENESMLTQDWYITKDYHQILKYTDIAAVIGAKGGRPSIVTVYGNTFTDLYGSIPKWNFVVEDILLKNNPHILTRGSTVTMPDDSSIDVSKAYKQGAYLDIVKEYELAKKS